MLRFLLVRIGQGALVLTGALLVSFALANLTGNPADLLRANPNMPPEVADEISKQMGYDDPLVTRFVNYAHDVVSGDLGTSYTYGREVRPQVLEAAVPTVELVLAALGIALLLSIPLSIALVYKSRSRLVRVANAASYGLQGVPDFWLSLLLILMFTVWLGWLPSIGFESPSSILMPALALGLPLVPGFTRLLRGEILQVEREDFALALKVKGISSRRAVWRHILPNAASPFIALIGLQLGWLFGGTLIVESVFGWPGLGNLLLISVNARDLMVVQAVVMLIAVVYVAMNIVADLAILALNPRLRTEGKLS